LGSRGGADLALAELRDGDAGPGGELRWTGATQSGIDRESGTSRFRVSDDLGLDSTEVPVYGEQEESAYNGYFESTCFHPLLLFNSQGDCLAVKLRPGNVHSAEGWEELLLPEIERQQGMERRSRSGVMRPLPDRRSTRRWRNGA